MSHPSMENRIAALEAEIADLRARLAAQELPVVPFGMSSIAYHLDCVSEVQAYTGPFVGGRFLRELLRAIPPHPQDWQKEGAAQATANNVSDSLFSTAPWARSGHAAKWATEWAAKAGVPIARQREILLGLMEDANADL